MDIAYEKGYTQTILWGLPLRKFEPPQEKQDKQDKQEALGNQLALEAIKIPKSITLETEFALAKSLLDNYDEHGELIAALIMLLTGVRTSEATGFSYKHLVELSPGYWGLVRYYVSKKDSRDTAGGGKTNNAFRILPVPKILVSILKERKKYLEKAFPGKDINSFPLACKGLDYRTRCTQKELNQKLKQLFKIVEANKFRLKKALGRLELLECHQNACRNW